MIIWFLEISYICKVKKKKKKELLKNFLSQFAPPQTDLPFRTQKDSHEFYVNCGMRYFQTL